MKRHGCHNRPELGQVPRPVQDGWYMDGTTRAPRMVAVSHAMTKDCQYTHSEAGRADPGCEGCRWRATP